MSLTAVTVSQGAFSEWAGYTLVVKRSVRRRCNHWSATPKRDFLLVAPDGRKLWYAEDELLFDSAGEETGCEHAWKLDPIVRDFGTYGVRSRQCKKCGLDQDSDPFTGAWPSAGEET